MYSCFQLLKLYVFAQFVFRSLAGKRLRRLSATLSFYLLNVHQICFHCSWTAKQKMVYEVVKIHAALLYPFHLCCVIKQTISCEWDKASVLPVIIRLHSHRLWVIEYVIQWQKSQYFEESSGQCKQLYVHGVTKGFSLFGSTKCSLTSYFSQ